MRWILLAFGALIFNTAPQLPVNRSGEDLLLMRLYEENIKPPMNYWTLQGKPSKEAIRTMKLFSNGNWDLALHSLFLFTPEVSELDHYNFYLAFCLLKLDFTDLALHHFTLVEKSSNLELVKMGSWYKSLTYLKRGQRDQSKRVLLGFKEGPFRYSAGKIITRLN